MNTQKNVVSLLSFLLVLCLIKKLNAVDPCVYNSKEKGFINLKSVGRTDGIPAWKNISPETPDGHVYSYNPCHSFTQHTCVDAAACQIYATDDNVIYPLGYQSGVQWRVTPGQDMPTIVYTGAERVLYVDLRCLDSGEPHKLEVHGHDPQSGQYTMTLSSKCACWNGCKDDSSSKSKLSGGTIVIILLIAFIFIYLVAFMAFNKFKRQATGIDILPHHTFWISLPRYSLDGIMFLFEKVTGKRTAYDSV